MKSFPKVNINMLSLIRAAGGEQPPQSPLSGGTGEGIVRGDIEVVKGRVPFEDYQYNPEVMGKSGYHFPGPEPLSYIRVDATLPLPAGFQSPDKQASQPASYWRSNAHLGNVVPYHFQTFEDIQRYDVYFSGFDLNGVYIGQSDLNLFDRERRKGRWDFNFKYLQRLNRFEFRQIGNGLIEIRLVGAQHDASTHKKSVNFIFGNFSVAIGESVEFLLGLGTQPLITAYNQNPYKDTLIYGLAYGSDGIILDHHDRGIGVEKVYIERADTGTYKIRLISYERILPVWEGIVRVPLDASS
jgi:hypothetical protein